MSTREFLTNVTFITPSERASTVAYGLDDADPAQLGSFPALLAMPFEKVSTRRTSLGNIRPW